MQGYLKGLKELSHGILSYFGHKTVENLKITI